MVEGMKMATPLGGTDHVNSERSDTWPAISEVPPPSGEEIADPTHRELNVAWIYQRKLGVTKSPLARPWL